MDDRIAQILRHQHGVVRRAQLVAAGLSPHEVRRLLRRRELIAVHPGIYVAQTGDLTSVQRGWAAVLSSWPAVLGPAATLALATGAELAPGPVQVWVDHQRTVRPPRGVVVRRSRRLGRVALWTASPPRLRLESAVLSIADAAASDDDAIGVLANAVQRRLTTPARLRSALSESRGWRRRGFLAITIDGVAEGSHSVLELRYARDVEEAHGLPAGRRQVRDAGARVRIRDVTYADYGLIVELDGRLGHTALRERGDDLDRDLEAAIMGMTTIRLGWRQVALQPCVTATQVDRLLRMRGWRGSMTACADCDNRFAGGPGVIR